MFIEIIYREQNEFGTLEGLASFEHRINKSLLYNKENDIDVSDVVFIQSKEQSKDILIAIIKTL